MVRHKSPVLPILLPLVLMDTLLLVEQMQMDVQEPLHVSAVLNILLLLLIFVLAAISSAEEQTKWAAKWHQPVNQK